MRENNNEGMRLIQGDCLEVMDKLIEGGVKVDAVICDPPYGNTACKWDVIIPFDEMWERLKKLRKDKSPIVLFGSEPFSSHLRLSNLKEYKYDWIWDKHIPRNFANAKYMPMSKHELISVFGKGKVNYYPIMIKREKEVRVKNYSKKNKDSAYKINTDGSDEEYRVYTHKNPNTIIVGKWQANKGKVHPTQKPVDLLEYLIKTYTNEGDTVLDFTMGSGTTGVACKNLGRKFIGIELDETYFDVSVKRIEETDKNKKDEKEE